MNDDISLDGEDIEQLNKALVDAYPEVATLRQMVRWRLNVKPPSRVVSSDNIREAVDQLVSWAETEGRLKDLITEAHNFRRGNPLLAKFASQHELVQDVDNTPTKVRFVIAAMTATQAGTLRQRLEAKLDAHTAGSGPEPADAELKLGKALMECGYTLSTLFQSYGPTPEAWHPQWLTRQAEVTTQGIGALIESVVKQINSVNAKQSHDSVPFEAVFLSERFFSSDEDVVGEAVREMAELGGTLIVDSLSLLHEDIGEKIKKEGLAAKENVATLVISPYSPNTLSANQLIETELSKQLLWPAYRRFQSLDHLCEFGPGDLLPVKRWLYTALPMAATQVSRALERNLELLRNNPKLRRNGIQNAFYQR
ncbi:MAG TPA: effector-associated domain EAD1-containing protein [Chloroflexia bacterium]|nr:effector-associated domain EAD1-containing protein [Chloroflexia bacterium]